MIEPAEISINPFECGYVAGLLNLEHKTLREMASKDLLPYSHGYCAHLLASDPKPYRCSLPRRLQHAPKGGYLAVDLVTVDHPGEHIQGVGRVYSSSDKGVVWEHSFVSSALVFKDQDPLPLQLAPFPSQRMATDTYPKLSASEGLLTVAGDVLMAGYNAKAAVFDAQFSTRLGLRSLKFLPLPFVGRCRTDLWVWVGKERLQVRELADRYPPGRARYYKRFGWYAKRLKVFLDEVGKVDLLLVWKKKGYGWECFALLSTFDAGVQEVLLAWKLRWELEKSHRRYKQNLGLGKCQCRRYAAQLKHADLVLEAFLVIRRERLRHPGLSWRRAQERVGAGMGNGVLTERSRKAA